MLQIAELCSGPSLLVQPGPTIAGGLAQEPQLQHLCPVRVCPGRGPEHQQKCSACPLGTTLLSAIRGRRVLEHIPARQGQEKSAIACLDNNLVNKTTVISVADMTRTASLLSFFSLTEKLKQN